MTNKTNFKPIAFAGGDGGAGRVADLVLKKLFPDFPTVNVPLTIEERLKTNDKCIETAVKAFIECQSGFKCSTASNDKRIIDAKMKSANIVMRPKMKAFGMLRMLNGPGQYKYPSGVLRYANGDFYDEQSCTQMPVAGRNVAVITQHLDLDAMIPFAHLAMQTAKEHELHLVIATKKTIAESERLFYSTITDIWKKHGLVEGKADDNGKIWTGDFHHELTDIAFANLPIETAGGRTPFANNKFLLVTGNAAGDSASDIVDFQHGNYVMSSTLYCEKKDKTWFTYEELPLGTADSMATGDLKGKNFYNPTSVIFGLTSAFQLVNPEQAEYFASLRRSALAYLKRTPKDELDTILMLETVKEESLEFA